MKQIIFNIFFLVFSFAIPDGSDGWFWRSEFSEEKNRKRHTDLFSIRIVESRHEWTGVEFIFLFFVFLVSWDD